jgi:anti-anti-sigma factor
MAMPSQILWIDVSPSTGFDFEGDISMSTQSRRSRLEVEDNGEVAVVNFIDRKILDEQNIQKIGEDLFSLIDQYDRKKILLNFKNVEYLSSAALGKFITLKRRCRPRAASW